LDRYNSIEEYFDSKTHIVAFQSQSDFAVLNIDNDRIKNLATQLQSKVITYSFDNTEADIHINRDYIIQAGVQFMHTDKIALYGYHNKYNVMAAIGVALSSSIPADNIISSIQTFKGIAGRQQSLGLVDGIEIINDTTSTMPVALMVAMDTFQDKPYVLLCGGEDKGLDYSDLAKQSYKNLKGIVLLPGSASILIKKYLANIPIYEVNTLSEGVTQAFSLANSGDRIVFSPGATSFGMFLNEFDRGDKFVALIESRKTN